MSECKHENVDIGAGDYCNQCGDSDDLCLDCGEWLGHT